MIKQFSCVLCNTIETNFNKHNNFYFAHAQSQISVNKALSKTHTSNEDIGGVSTNRLLDV